MKRAIFFALLLFPFSLFAQLGLKAGYNYSSISNAKQINSSSRSGFHAGVFLAPSAKGLISSRTELIFSRQGYNFETGTNTGSVDLDYIILPQLMGINLTKFVQLQAGFQFAYLINAKADSTKATGTANPVSKMTDLYNRFDYGFAAGVEIHPVKGLILGARANFSLGKLYKEPQPGRTPSFIPDIRAKNDVVQVFAGWKFGS